MQKEGMEGKGKGGPGFGFGVSDAGFFSLGWVLGEVTTPGSMWSWLHQPHLLGKACPGGQHQLFQRPALSKRTLKLAFV